MDWSFLATLDEVGDLPLLFHEFVFEKFVLLDDFVDMLQVQRLHDFLVVVGRGSDMFLVVSGLPLDFALVGFHFPGGTFPRFLCLTEFLADTRLFLRVVGPLPLSGFLGELLVEQLFGLLLEFEFLVDFLLRQLLSQEVASHRTGTTEGLQARLILGWVRRGLLCGFEWLVDGMASFNEEFRLGVAFLDGSFEEGEILGELEGGVAFGRLLD